MSSPVSYRVTLPHPHSHLFEVQAHFPATTAELTVALPVWTPGSYLVREYSRHVQDLAVVGLDDKPVAWSRTDKRSIRVQAGGRPFRMNYKVYANELTVRTSHLDGSHGYFNGATLFYYCEEFRAREHRVAVLAPAGWNVSTSLKRQGSEFLAPDYDELVDAPFEMGPHTPLSFVAAGIPHRVVIWGDPVLDTAKLTADLARVCEEEAKFFGGLPMKDYTFFIYATDKGRGGLEHKNSTALLYPRHGFATPKGWEDFLTLAAHEYFHLWNVKRIKPRAFVPFDYGKEAYTTLLWAFEGGTSYYDNLLVRRAGLMSPARYLTRLGESLTSLHSTPGRKALPLADASYLAWVKHYRPDENTGNTAISYYLKGEIVCLLLDLTLREATQGKKSLDDVYRLLWSRYGDESGVPEDGVERAAQEVAGIDLAPFFEASLRGTSDLDYRVLNHVGLEVRFRQRESSGDKGGTPPRVKSNEAKPKGWLGVTAKAGSAIATVTDASPAMRAGLYPDDEVVALDGHRCDAGTLSVRCEDKAPGDTVRVTLFRRERMMEVAVTLGDKPAEAAYLARVEKPTDAQKAAYQAWTGAAWDDA